MANGGSIKYNIGFNVDKTGLNQLKSSLQEIKAMTAQDLMKIGGHDDITKATKDLEALQGTIKQIDGALERAFNTDLGTLNVAKFNQELSKMNLNKVYQDFSEAGSAGQAAFRNTTAQILTTNMQLKQTHSLLDNMAATMANTVKWGVASSVMNNFTGTVQQAYGYVKSLDSSLNDIRIVTEKSAEEMDKFAVKANNAAKALGQSTTNYTDAALIYYQQGLSDEEVAARAEVTLKAANVTGQSGEEVSEQLTAVWNGYKVTAQEAELYVDKLAAVAAETAADLEELSVGMSKVASAANLMGVDVDQLNAQLATIVSVTRQAPESVGTALKTIYARMGDIEAGLDSEVSLGDYTEKMAAMGVNVLDMNGELRDMGEVMEEIGAKWTSMSREQQIYLSQVMAGTRQYNNLLSLFDNWDMYTEALDTSQNSMGTLQEQQDTYMESTAAHLATLKSTWEDLYDSLLDADSVNTVVDGLTVVVDLLGNFVDSVGGGIGVLGILGSVGMQVFGKQIASSLATTIVNMQAAKQNAQQLEAEMAILSQFENADINDARTQRLIEMKRQQLDLTKSLTTEERNISNEYIKQQNALYEQQDDLKNRMESASQLYEQLSGKQVNFETADKKTIEDAEMKFKGKSTESFDEASRLEKQIGIYQELKNVAQQYRDVANATEIDKEELLNVLQRQEDAIRKNQKAINANITEAERLAESDEIATENKKELIAALDEFYKLTNGGIDINLENINHLKALERLEKARIKTHKNEGEAYKSKAKEVGHFTAEIKNNEVAVETLNQRWTNFIKQIDLRNNIMQFTTLIGKVGQVVSGINSLKQIPSIFNNEDLATGEKFLQIISSLSMGFPMLVNGIMGSIETFNKLRTSINNNLLMTSLYNNAVLKTMGIEKANNAQEALNLVLQEAGIKLTKEEIANLTVAEARQKIKNALDKGEIQDRAAIRAATRFNIIEREQENKTISKTILLKMKELALNPMFWVAAAGIAAVTATIWLSVKAQNASKDAMEKANKELEKQQESYRKIKEEYDALKSTLENYNNSKKAIEELTKGSIAWKEAVQELNQEVIDLMQKYPELAKYVTNENGILTISEEDQEAIAEKEFQKTQIAYQNELYAQQKANEATREYKTEQLGKSIDIKYDKTKTATYTSGGAPVGPQSYYAPGQELYYGTYEVTDNVSQEDINKVVDAMQENSALLGDQNALSDVLYGKNFEELTAAEKATVEALQANDEELNRLSNEMQGMDIADEIAKQQSFVSAMQGQEVFKDTDITTLQTIAKLNQDAIEAATKKNKANYEDLSKEELAKLSGFDESEYDEIPEKKGTITLKKDGEEIGSIIRDAAVETLAQNEAINEFYTKESAEANIKTVESMVENANKLSNGLGDYLSSFAGGNAGATGAQVQDFMNQMDSSYFVKNNYKLYGFESEADFQQEIEEAARQYWENYNGIVNAQGLQASANQASDIQGIISKGSTEDLEDEQIAHLESLEEKYLELGEIQDRNSHEYLERLREVIELEEDAARKELEIQRERDEADAEYYANQIDRYEELKSKIDESGMSSLSKEELEEWNSIDIEADVTAFEETMQNLQDNYAEMKVQIDADLKTDVDEAFGLAEEFGKLQDMVADDLTITFEEAQNLINQGYGEMLQNAQYTNEQAIMLDKATMNAFIDSRQAELEADKEAKITQLQGQRTILVSQAEALKAKLGFLDVALNATNATDAAEALSNAAKEEAKYQASVTEMSETLKAESDTLTEEEKLNSELYNSLGGMYDQDSLNQQSAEEATTNQQKQEIDNRIQNVKALHEAYVSLSAAVRASATGSPVGAFTAGTTTGSGGTNAPTSDEVKGTGDYSYKEIKPEDIDWNKFVNDEGLTKESRKAVETMKETTEQEYNSILDQIGAIDAGIAALLSGGTSLDKAQADAKKGGSKGSGSGSSDKEKDPDYMESLNDERDAYHDINYEIEKLNDELSKQERITSKLTGKDRIKALEKELEILGKQAEKEKTKLEMLQSEQKTLQDKLSSQGVTFDAEGDISNFNDALEKQEAIVNAKIAEYNAASAEEQENRLKAEVEKAKAIYEQFKEDMERYDELVLDEIADSEDKINEALDKQIELQIEQFELEIELKLDTNEAKRQLNDFIKEHVKGIEDDDYAGIAQYSLNQLSTYTGKDGDLAINEAAMQEALDAYENIKAGGTDDVYGNDAAKALEAYEKYRDKVMDTYGEIGDLIDAVNEAQLDGIKEVNDKFDEQLEKYDQIEDALNRRLELSQLLSGEDNYEVQLKYQEQMKQNNLERQQLLQQEIASLEKYIAVEIAAGRGNTEAVKEMQKSLEESQEELAETTAESLELIAESYETAKQKLIKDVNDSVTGGLGLDYISQEWELINENADMYLDTINSAYEVSQLESKFRDAIDNTDSVYAQERLNSLMDKELGKLREKDKLTQYEVDRANKMLDIELKKIALEEAQSSKTQMRLRRDSQGNYTYQYVADQDKVAEAQRALEEAENELYNMDKEAYKDNLDQIKSAYEEYIDEVNELNILYADNEEEFYRQLALLTEKYNERIGGLTEQNQEIGFNLQGSTLSMVAKITGQDEDELKNLPQEEIDRIMSKHIPQWSSGVAQMVTQLANGGFGDLANQLVEQILKLKEEQEKEMKDAAAAGGESLDEIASGADIVSQKFKDIDTETQEIVSSLDTMMSSLSKNVTEAEKFAENMKEAAEASAQIIADGNRLAYDSSESNSSSRSNGIILGTQKITEVAVTGTAQKAIGNLEVGITPLQSSTIGRIGDFENQMLDTMVGEISVEGFKAFSGRLIDEMNAISMLNKDQTLIQDTFTRFSELNTEISNALEKVTANRIFELENQNLFKILDKLTQKEEIKDTLEQRVHITADFPNVSSTAEIEEAFNHLITVASQYAFKTNR